MVRPVLVSTRRGGRLGLNTKSVRPSGAVARMVSSMLNEAGAEVPRLMGSVTDAD